MKKKLIIILSICLIGGGLLFAGATSVTASCSSGGGTICSIGAPEIQGTQQRGRVHGSMGSANGSWVSARVTHFGNDNVSASSNWTSGQWNVTATTGWIPRTIGAVTTTGQTTPGH